MQEVEDEPLFAERVAGIDIAKAEVMVTIRVLSDSGSGRRQQETRAFRAVRTDLLALADWLRCWQVTRVGMEATSDYWKPVYFLLEREGFDRQLYHAGQVKARPWPPEDRQARLGVAGQDHRARVAGVQLRAAGGDPAAAHPYPVPAAPDPGPHRREAAGGEAARRRPRQAVQRDH